jgi:isopentenyl phosphate kinase
VTAGAPGAPLPNSTPPPGAPPIIVKLGGSILTRKKEAARVRAKLLVRLAREVAEGREGPVILLHGAGSFGHPGAIRFRLAEPPGATDGIHRARGAALVSAEVRRLHGLVLRALLDEQVPVWSVPAATVARSSAGTLVAFDPAPFASALARGLVPLSFGDVVPDDAWGFSILSADAIAVALARTLGARRVLFVSDVDGVLTERPGRGKPAIHPRVDASVLDRLDPVPGAPDVTGGIRGKVRAMLALSALHVDAGLISGVRHDSLRRALRGETVYGSWSWPGPD